MKILILFILIGLNILIVLHVFPGRRGVYIGYEFSD
jgi:hypothetical protein